MTQGAIIMAGSGMCTGGRVRHHLRHNLARSESSVIFVGYAAERTLARQIIEGAKTVSIHGEKIAVNAALLTIGGFSAHADQRELLAWQKSAAPSTTFLVHGDAGAKEHFAKRLNHTRVEIPSFQAEFNF